MNELKLSRKVVNAYINEEKSLVDDLTKIFETAYNSM